jgi:hypothetical protein
VREKLAPHLRKQLSVVSVSSQGLNSAIEAI